MTPHLPEFAGLARGLALDGELIAFGEDGKPSFPRLCERMLHGHEDIPVMFIAFDVLHARGESTLRLPYRRRRAILEALDSKATTGRPAPGRGRRSAMAGRVPARPCGIVAKKRGGHYRPGRREWVKVKNPGLLAIPA
jgi:bifunctional non-homologous end joining protein LigD